MFIHGGRNVEDSTFFSCLWNIDIKSLEDYYEVYTEYIENPVWTQVVCNQLTKKTGDDTP